MFIVRFLGSMAVQSDATSDVIYEAMRQVLAARAIHNIFRMTESHLMVTSKNLRYCETFNLSMFLFSSEVFWGLFSQDKYTLQDSKIPVLKFTS